MQGERDPFPFKCTKCNKTFPSGYALSGHQNAHYRNGVPHLFLPPTPPPQIHNHFLSARDEVNQLPLTLSIGSTSRVSDYNNHVLIREEILWRQRRISRYHPYQRPDDKDKEPLLHVETVVDNFKEIVTLDLLREWHPKRGLGEGSYEWAMTSSSNQVSQASTGQNGEEKLDLELKLGF
ncbi:hypothetical protein SLE2022_138610 [Rubroshorea leprosula]